MKKTLFALSLFSILCASSTFAALPGMKRNCLEHLDHISTDLSYCNLKDKDIVKLVDYINSHPDYTQYILYLDGNKIGPDGAEQLAKIKSSQLKALSLTSNQIGTKGAIALSKSNYEQLYVDDNEIGKEGIKALAGMKLIALDVGDNNLDADDVIALAKNKSLSILGLEGAVFNNQAIDALAKNAQISDYNLSNTTLGQADVEKILRGKDVWVAQLAGLHLKSAQFLLQFPHLMYAILANNDLGGSYAGTYGLLAQKQLDILDLSDNHLGDNVVKSIVAEIDHEVSYLNLDGDNVTDASVEILNKKSPFIDRLNLTADAISYDGYKKLSHHYGSHVVTNYNFSTHVAGISQARLSNNNRDMLNKRLGK